MRFKAFTFVMFLAIPAAALAQPYKAPPPFPGGDGLCRDGDQAFARQAETLITDGINAERAQFAPDAPPLQPDPRLIAIARQRSCGMAEGEQDFSHTDAEGNFIAGDMVEARVARYGATGENIMKMGGTLVMLGAARPFGPEEFARVAVEGWMKSPGHRENILNPRYHISGIGVAMMDGQAFATQVFYGPPQRREKKPAPDDPERRSADRPSDRQGP
ncbi:MAG TPA: CAP domain-containing protein [Rhizomicrobium sp.]|nr:CAP domain-containing protein [Rhizomicrobium sp.]